MQLLATSWFCLVIPVLVSAQNYEECGRSTKRGKDYNEFGIVSGGEYPYFCALYVDLGDSFPFIGGATLIQRNQLLSLATLFDHLKLLEEKEEVGCQGHKLTHKVVARCGSVNIKEVPEGGSHQKQDRIIKRVMIHPEYHNGSLINDFAILMADQPFEYTQTVGRVCLPATGSPAAELSYLDNCVALGHGADGPDQLEAQYSSELRKAELPLVSPELCEKLLNEEHFSTPEGGLIQNWRLHESHLCAGGKDQVDTCKGDGGGPLVCSDSHDIIDLLDFDLRSSDDEETEDAKFTQYGVTAWGVGCGLGLPGVYSKVSQAMCWIDQVMSCNPAPAEDLSFIDLRSGRSGGTHSPDSVNRLRESDCSAWLSSNLGEGCCSQTLVNSIITEINSESDTDYFDLRSDTDTDSIDLRSADLS